MSYARRRALGAADAATSSSPTSVVKDLVGSDAVTTGTAAAMIYHGYRRTGSVVWALLYGLAGKKLPVVAIPVALAQGYGKRRTCSTE